MAAAVLVLMVCMFAYVNSHVMMVLGLALCMVYRAAQPAIGSLFGSAETFNGLGCF